MEARVTKFAQFSRVVEIKNYLSLSSHESTATILISLQDISSKKPFKLQILLQFLQKGIIVALEGCGTEFSHL